MTKEGAAQSYLIAFTSSIGGLVFGYEIGIINSVLEMASFSGYFYAGVASVEDVTGWIVSSFLLGCMAGAVCVAWLADRFGRKRTLLLGAAVFTLGGALQTASTSLLELYLTRFVGGMSIGVLSMVCPLYISEVAPAETRGRLISVQQLMIVLGIFCSSVVNALLYSFAGGLGDVQWRLAFGMQCIPGAALFVLALALPFSPRWLVAQGREEEATAVLTALRHVPAHNAALQAEIKAIREAVEGEKLLGRGWRDLVLRPDIRARLLIACWLQFFQQATGINVIMYYSADLFSRMGIPKDTAATTLVIVNAAVTVLSTLPGMYLIEHPRVGRRQLLLWGAVGMAGAHSLVCTFVLMLPPPAATEGGGESKADASLSWSAVVSMYFFVFAFASTWGPVVWVVDTEIFPMAFRAKGTAAAAFVNWMTNAIIGKVTPLMLRDMGGYTYLVYGGFCVIMGVYTYFAVPETAGITLEQMDALFPVHTSVSSGGRLITPFDRKGGWLLHSSQHAQSTPMESGGGDASSSSTSMADADVRKSLPSAGESPSRSYGSTSSSGSSDGGGSGGGGMLQLMEKIEREAGQHSASAVGPKSVPLALRPLNPSAASVHVTE